MTERKEEIDEFVEISLPFARDIGLVPYVDLFRPDYGGYGRKFVDESIIRIREERIIEDYCSNKNLMLCRFKRSTVLSACQKSALVKNPSRKWWEFWK